VTKIVDDTATRRVTTLIVLAVGLFAASDSYSHIFALALDHGQGIVSAALLPLAGDGSIAAASSAMMVAARQGLRTPVIARCERRAVTPPVLVVAWLFSTAPPHGRDVPAPLRGVTGDSGSRAWAVTQNRGNFPSLGVQVVLE
jgi:hypothetical protein